VLSLMLSARQELDPNTISEGFNTLRNALTRQGEGGKLAEQLRNLGLSNDQSFIEKIRTIRQGRQSGEITEQDIQALGGTRAQGVLAAFSKGLPRLDEARQALETGDVEQLIQRQRQNPTVRAAERANRRDLRGSVASEQSGMGGGAEVVDEFITRQKEQGGGSVTLGVAEDLSVGNFGNLAAEAGQATVNYVYTNIAQQINRAKDPDTGDLDTAVKGQPPE